jgi:hypothetical protein
MYALMQHVFADRRYGLQLAEQVCVYLFVFCSIHSMIARLCSVVPFILRDPPPPLPLLQVLWLPNDITGFNWCISQQRQASAPTFTQPDGSATINTLLHAVIRHAHPQAASALIDVRGLARLGMKAELM